MIIINYFKIDMPNLTTREVFENPGLRFAFSLMLDDLRFSRQAATACSSGGSEYVGEAVQRTERYLRQSPGTGQRAIDEIKASFKKLGVALGTTIIDCPSSFKADLAAIRKAREESLPELERLAAWDNEDSEGNRLGGTDWLQAAKHLLTPNILSLLEDERHRIIIAGRLQDPPRTLKDIASEIGISHVHVGYLERHTITASLKQAIRQDLLSRQLAALSADRK